MYVTILYRYAGEGKHGYGWRLATTAELHEPGNTGVYSATVVYRPGAGRASARRLSRRRAANRVTRSYTGINHNNTVHLRYKHTDCATYK